MANIAFDVDGVMTNLAKFQLDTGRKYFGERRRGRTDCRGCIPAGKY